MEQRKPSTRRAAQSPPYAASAQNGVEVVETYFDTAGRPTARKGIGAARVARRYDEHGHQVEEAYFNAEGKPTARDGLGAARIAWRYDDNGNRVEAALYGPDGAQLVDRGVKKRDFQGV